MFFRTSGCRCSIVLESIFIAELLLLPVPGARPFDDDVKNDVAGCCSAFERCCLAGCMMLVRPWLNISDGRAFSESGLTSSPPGLFLNSFVEIVKYYYSGEIV